MKLLTTMEEKTQFDVEVSTIDTSSSEGTIIEASDYHLTRDKARMEIVVAFAGKRSFTIIIPTETGGFKDRSIAFYIVSRENGFVLVIMSASK